MTSTTLQRFESYGLSGLSLGSGRPIIFLHGVGLKADAWENQMKAFGNTHQIIAPDMPGHGSSPAIFHANTLDDFSQAYVRLLEGLPEPALVVGHSMGAMIALDLASKLASRVCGVVALNAIFQRETSAALAVQSRAGTLDGQTVPDPEPTLTRWFGDHRSAQRSSCEEWLRNVDPAGYKAAYQVFAQSDGPDVAALQSLSCPGLFMTGSDEPNSTPEMSQRMASLAPKGRAIVVQGAAHMMPMTHADRVNNEIRSFAKEVWP